MALAGYNPNASLLPSGSGPIQAMSGGGMGPPPGFNPQMSLLPSAGGDINSYRGGFMSEPIQIIPNSATPPSFTGGAKKPTGLKEVSSTSDTIQVKWDNFDPTGNYGGRAVPALPEEGKPVPATRSAVVDKTTGIATFDKLAPNTQYTIQIWVGKSTSADETIKVTTKPKSDSTGSSTNKPAEGAATGSAPGTVNATEKPANATEKPANNGEEKTRPIILFGTTINLTNPKKMNSDKLTDDQVTALQKFGLDGPGLSDKEKFNIIQALFDGKCNTDQPMIFLQNCDPIRRVIQTLALNLLEKLEANDSETQLGVKKEDQPVVEFKELEDKSMRICLTFKPEQLGLLSKFAPKITTKKSNKGASTKKNASPETNVPPPPPPPPPATPGSIQPNITETHTDTTIIITYSKALKEDGSVNADVTYKASIKKGNTSANILNVPTDSKNSADGKTTTVTFSNLTPDTTYTIEVVATKGTQTATGKIEVETDDAVSPPPPPPPAGNNSIEITDLEESRKQSDRIAVMWTGKAGVTYTAQAQAEGGPVKDGKITEQNEGKRIALFTDLIQNTKYNITITATKGADTKTAKIEVQTLREDGAPEAPAGEEEPLSEEELNRLLDELLAGMGGLNLPADKKAEFNGLKAKKPLTPEELQELDDILASLSAPNLPPGSPMTIEEMKALLAKIRKGSEPAPAAPPGPNNSANSIKPGNLYFLEEPTTNQMTIFWDFNTLEGVEYTATATPKDGGDEVTGTIKSEDELPELGKYAEFTGLQSGITYTVKVVAKKGNKDSTATGEFTTAQAPPPPAATGSLIKPLVTIVKLSPTSFKVLYIKQSGATYTLTTTKKETNNGAEENVEQPPKNESNQVYSVSIFENMAPGIYKITVKGTMGTQEEEKTETIKLPGENNAAAQEVPEGEEGEGEVEGGEYKDCDFTVEQLNEQFPIVTESVSNNRGSEFEEMEIPNDGWCLYMAAQLSLDGKFRNGGGNAYSNLSEVINKVAQYLRDNKAELSNSYLAAKAGNANSISFKTQVYNGSRHNVETFDDYIKYLITPRETRDITIPEDADIKCKVEQNGKTREYFVFDDEAGEEKHIPVFEGPLLWPDLQIIGEALSSVLEEPIFVFTKKQNTGKLELTNNFISKDNKGSSGIYLLYNGTNHYNALIPKFIEIPPYLTQEALEKTRERAASSKKKNENVSPAGLFGKNENNFENQPAAANVPAPPAPQSEEETAFKPSNKNLANRKKLAENAVAAKRAANERKAMEKENQAAAAPKQPEPPQNKRPTINIPNNGNSVLTGLSTNTPGGNSVLTGLSTNTPGQPVTPVSPLTPVNNKAAPPNRQYKKANVKTLQGQLSKLQVNLQKPQKNARTRTAARAKTIRNIQSNIASLANYTGRNSKTIKNKIDQIKAKYKDVNKTGYLATVGGKKKTFKKANLKKKRSTMKKRK